MIKDILNNIYILSEINPYMAYIATKSLRQAILNEEIKRKENVL